MDVTPLPLPNAAQHPAATPPLLPKQRARMADQAAQSTAALRKLIWPLRLTRAGMIAEQVTRAFWPVWTVLLGVVAALALGAHAPLPRSALPPIGAAIGVGLVGLMVFGVRRYRHPSREAALARLDETLPGRPISTLMDAPAMAQNNPATQSVWAAHIARMADRAAQARAPEPDLRLSDRDPFALRYIAATAFALALLFGSFTQIGQIGTTPAGTGPIAEAATGPSWEGWVEPPLYTGLPSLYLNDIAAQEFEAPIGSEITLRNYGDPDGFRIRTNVGPVTEGTANGTIQRVVIESAGQLEIDAPGGRGWHIAVRPDAPPEVELIGEVTGEPPGSIRMEFTARDDFGVRSGSATIRLDLAAVDRRYGLSLDPEPREPIALDLPMPFRNDRAEFTETLVDDLSQHPFANLPVALSLSVVDDAGQVSTASYEIDRLPGRRFFDPLAGGLIELRRDLLWNRDNAPRIARLLRAMTHRPEPGLPEDVYRPLRAAIGRLEAAVDLVSLEVQEDVAQILWDAAWELEFGDLDSAAERLARAQERLEEAMRQGASDAEIAELMQDLREATDDYMQELAENFEPGDSTDQPDQDGETIEMSMADIEEMMRQIEELMQQGRMAEAMEMLQALQDILENMEITEGGEGGDGPQTPGQQAMEGLQDTLRGQQQLSDESFQELQDQFNPNRPGQSTPEAQGQAPQGNQEGQDGEMAGDSAGGDSDDQSLAERQEELRQQLQDQARRLPATGNEAGDEALDQLDGAGRAMDQAAEALERGDIAEALDLQSQAMEAIREGMTQLSEALAQEQGAEPGQGQVEGNMAEGRPLEDPLGRQAGNNGAFGDEQAIADLDDQRQRARELQDLLRDRSADQGRPAIELDYLRRLLEQF